MGLSFAPNPDPDIHCLERDLYELSRKLRLTYHFRNSNNTDTSIVKLNSSFCPKRNADQELENICSNLEQLPIFTRRTRDNIQNEREGLLSLTRRTTNMEIVIKPADKGSITVVMDPLYYHNMCLEHLEDRQYYQPIADNPSDIVLEKVVEFANNYQQMLTKKEHEYLTSSAYKMSNIYMLPKLHKSKRIDEIITSQQKEYIHITDEDIVLEGRPICSGPCYFTRGVSLIIHEILVPCVDMIDHIVRDTFDFKDRIAKSCEEEDTVLCTWDIKSLYTNIRHELFIESVDYWIRKFQYDLPLLRRFSLGFVLEGLKLILQYNYVTFNGKFYRQIKGVAMGAPAAVVGSNLVVAFLEARMFVRLPDLFPNDFVDFFIRNYFRFLDDLFHKWLTRFDIDEFANILNNLDPDLRFILDQIARSVHYLDVQPSIVNKELLFDMFYKPTNSFTYLKYSSCHPRHTRNNIAGSLARRIIQLVSTEEGRQQRLDDLSVHLQQRGHTEENINMAFLKVMQPRQAPPQGESIVFTRTFNPGHVFDKNAIKSCITGVKRRELVKSFGQKRILLATRQPPNLKKLLTSAKFHLNPTPREPRKVGLIPCGNCKYCSTGYIVGATGFDFVSKDGRVIEWTYNRLFSCRSMNILYLLKCKRCRENYLGKSDSTKRRVGKHKSDVLIPENSNCRVCADHLRDCSKLVEPYFVFYPFFYVDNPGLRHFMERRFINNFKPTLNGQ